jgi:hypothetical protein
VCVSVTRYVAWHGSSVLQAKDDPDAISKVTFTGSASCLVLFCSLFFLSSVLSCPVLSCPVLSCPVLSCPVLSCPVLSCPVLSCRWCRNGVALPMVLHVVVLSCDARL